MITSEDHDAIIRLEANQLHICKKLDALIGSTDTKLDQLLELREKKVSWKSLWGLVSIFILLVGSIFAYNFQQDSDRAKIIHDHTSQISVHDKQITTLESVCKEDNRY